MGLIILDILVVLIVTGMSLSYLTISPLDVYGKRIFNVNIIDAGSKGWSKDIDVYLQPFLTERIVVLCYIHLIHQVRW